jgi:hypothetical protein
MTSWRDLIFNNMNFRIYWNTEDENNLNLSEDSNENILDFLNNMENVDLEIDFQIKTKNRIEEDINKTHDKLKSGVDCSICLIELNNKKRIVSRLKCNHLFHKMCIKKWFKQTKTCPICRY